MRLYKVQPNVVEVIEHRLPLWGQTRYSVRHNGGEVEWMTRQELDRKYEPVFGDGWPSVTREENA